MFTLPHCFPLHLAAFPRTEILITYVLILTDSHTLTEIAAPSLVSPNSILSLCSRKGLYISALFSSLKFHLAELILSLTLPLCDLSYQAFTYLAPSAVRFGQQTLFLWCWAGACVITISLYFLFFIPGGVFVNYLFSIFYVIFTAFIDRHAAISVYLTLQEYFCITVRSLWSHFLGYNVIIHCKVQTCEHSTFSLPLRLSLSASLFQCLSLTLPVFYSSLFSASISLSKMMNILWAHLVEMASSQSSYHRIIKRVKAVQKALSRLDYSIIWIVIAPFFPFT